MDSEQTAAGAYERALRAVLAQLESVSATPQSIAAATHTCAAAFDGLRTDAAGSRLPAALDALARSRGLLAVLRETCVREQELSARRLQLARAARRAFAQQCAEPGSAACDCAG